MWITADSGVEDNLVRDGTGSHNATSSDRGELNISKVELIATSEAALKKDRPWAPRNAGSVNEPVVAPTP